MNQVNILENAEVLGLNKRTCEVEQFYHLVDDSDFEF